ncbi:hypothetical protein TrVE_jg1068 [Triparma verrucosa]|uniref:Uncharacterized protein n=1 Tax=Triparma verrucosa TaxID=1606542 RepID=A0A9W7EK36_9STRA|nr:hypothetical protein TrVE_jg1068 [Triparma verrucosa]
MSSFGGQDAANAKENSNGWAREKDAPNVISKKYDPHAETRRNAYEREQAIRHKARMAQMKKNPSTATTAKPMKTNSASTFEDRRAAVLAKKEKARQEKIAKARANNEKVAARKARMEKIQQQSKQATTKPAVDISELPPHSILELDSALTDVTLTQKENRADPRTKAGAGSECATCRSTADLEEDVDNRGIFYCKSCWDTWANE